MPFHKTNDQQTQCALHRGRIPVRSLDGSRAHYAVLVWSVPGAYTIMPTGVDARARKCLYVSDGSFGSAGLQQQFQTRVTELRAHHHSGHTGSIEYSHV